MPFDGTDFSSDAAIMRAARDGIADPERWCQGRLNNGPAHCVEGWLLAAGARDGNIVERMVSELLFPELPWWQRIYVANYMHERARRVVSYQDVPGRRHAAVVALFDRAIARLEAPCPTSR